MYRIYQEYQNINAAVVSLPKNLRKKFATYDSARNALRKWIRTNFSDTHNRSNPSISDYGFSILKV